MFKKTMCIIMKLTLAFAFLLLMPIDQIMAGDVNKKDVVSEKSDESNEVMAKWQAYSTPNENHRVLDVFVGSWDYTVKWWLQAGSEPETSTGVSNIKWILGGRFLQHSVVGNSKERPFEGMGIIGFDNSKNQYVAFWMDTMATGVMTADGKYDSNKKTLTENGTFMDPVSGKKSFKGITTIISNDKYKYEMYTSGTDGKEFLNLEIIYTRK
jgi:hypothetical protein